VDAAGAQEGRAGRGGGVDRDGYPQHNLWWQYKPASVAQAEEGDGEEEGGGALEEDQDGEGSPWH
jgi:hypothetical protein